MVDPGSTVLVVGGAGLVEALAEHGLRADRVEPRTSRPPSSRGSVPTSAGRCWPKAPTRWPPESRGSRPTSTSPCRRRGGRAPGNGTLVAALATTSGREPIVTGKPERPLFDEAVARTAATRPLVVGDRLDTDIEGAVNAGLDSLLVLTGVTTALDAVLAPPQAPTDLPRPRPAGAARARRDRRAARAELWRVRPLGRRWSRRRGCSWCRLPGPTGDRPRATTRSTRLTAACAAAWAYEGELDGVDGLPRAACPEADADGASAERAQQHQVAERGLDAEPPGSERRGRVQLAGDQRQEVVAGEA